jgi:hypothetical protein
MSSHRFPFFLLLAAVAILPVACSAPSTSSNGPHSTAPFPTIPNAGGTAPGQLPGSNPACQQASAPIAGIAQVEAALRSGGTTDASAEESVLSIQQTLVAVVQQVGEQSEIGGAIQQVVHQLGELGTALNQNAGIEVLNPLLANVDAAVVALSAACATG